MCVCVCERVQLMNEQMTSMRAWDGHALPSPGWSVVDRQDELQRGICLMNARNTERKCVCVRFFVWVVASDEHSIVHFDGV